MNKRTIILDFTSLLDVIMIILFFFIIFSHMETESAKLSFQAAEENASMREEEAEQLLLEANRLIDEAEEKNRLADEKLAEAELAEIRSGENAESIANDFGQSLNIRLKLRMSGSGWQLDIYKGHEKAGTVPYSDTNGISDINTMAEAFSAIVHENGYTEQNTILCEFIYDAAEPGTRSAYEDINKILVEAKKKYKHLFYSVIDNSVFEEE